MFGKAKLAAISAEFLGTAVLALAVLAVASRTSFSFFAAITAALVAGLMVLLVGSASGAQLNPAISLGLWSQRKQETTQTIVYIGAQMLGGVVAWWLGQYLLGQRTEHIADWGVDWRVVTAEAVGAFVFGFGVAAAVSKGYEGSVLASVVGGSLGIGVLVASLGSNGVINPAVAAALDSMSWAYAVGPLAGVVVGMTLYNSLFETRSAKVKKVTRRKK